MNIRSISCTFAGLLAVVFLIALTPRHDFTSKGIVLPAQHIRPAISPDDVTLYHQMPTAHVESLGQVRAELSFHTLNTETQDALFQKVKTLAAGVGANGVVINYLVPDDGVRHMLMFIGTAIYLPRSKH